MKHIALFSNALHMALCLAAVAAYAGDTVAASPPAAAQSFPDTQPSPPAWLAQDPSRWPQILLVNDAVFSDNTVMRGASGFLMRLPDGGVVAATAKHLLGENAKLKDFSRLVKSWSMHPPLAAFPATRLTGLAESLPDSDSLGWLVMTPASQTASWAAPPLLARTEELTVGETVYLLAVPEGVSSRQNVYKGTVTHLYTGEFGYRTQEQPPTRGFSGAPIIDSQGRIAAVHTGHANDGSEFIGISTATVLGFLQSPPHPAITKATDATRPAAQPISPEDAAQTALRGVKIYIDNKMYELARRKLQKIIDTYPGTAAAAKALETLHSLPS